MRFYVLIMMANVFFLTAIGQEKRNIDEVLEITCAVLLNDQRVSDYAISVYLDGTRIDSSYAKSKKPLKIYVGYNKVYTFLFQKENCRDKIMIVNTQLQDELKSKEDNTFDFEVEMSRSLSKNSKDPVDPVTVMLIDKKEQLLQASTDYNKFTHSNPDVIRTNHVENTSDKKMNKK